MGLIYKKEACFNTLFSYCLAWSNDLLILDLSYLKVRLRIPIGNSLVKEKGTASSMATWQKKMKNYEMANRSNHNINYIRLKNTKPKKIQEGNHGCAGKKNISCSTCSSLCVYSYGRLENRYFME